MAAKKKKSQFNKAKFDILRLRLDSSGSKLRGKALRAAALALLEAALQEPKGAAKSPPNASGGATPCDDNPNCVFLYFDGPSVMVYKCNGQIVRYEVG
ncbi:MAG: hypothetical protein IPK26_12395 [Planctomycetes bacterium]|nr:hypothetical protein [Planctomycetota bacterium]